MAVPEALIAIIKQGLCRLCKWGLHMTMTSNFQPTGFHLWVASRKDCKPWSRGYTAWPYVHVSFIQPIQAVTEHVVIKQGTFSLFTSLCTQISYIENWFSFLNILISKPQNNIYQLLEVIRNWFLNYRPTFICQHVTHN